MREQCDADGLAWEAAPCPEAAICVPCESEPCDDLCIGACDPRRFDEFGSAGCSYLAARQLGLSEALGPFLGVEEDLWPADGLLLHNPTEYVATVQVYDLAQGSNEPEALGDPVELQPGDERLVDLPTPLPLGGISILRSGSMVWVESDVPITAASYSPYSVFHGNDSSMLLPEHALGLLYVVPSFPPHYLQYQGAGLPTYFDVLATEENTTVRWLAQFAGTAGTGIPIDPVPVGEWSEEYVVNRFEGVRVMAEYNEADPHASDVSGMVIEASAPIYVIGGSRCSAVPEGDVQNLFCDPLTEALIPVELWGSTYVAAHPPVRTDEQHYYRIYAGESGVTATTTPNVLSGPDVTFDSRGAYVDVVVPTNTDFVVEADGPIMVVGYLASRPPDAGTGDPAMYQIVPVEQADTTYSLVAPEAWDEQYLMLARQDGAADVNLDGTAVTGWETVGNYSVATVVIASGAHVLESSDPFTATQMAYNHSGSIACVDFGAPACNCSYAHPVGMRTEVLYEP